MGRGESRVELACASSELRFDLSAIERIDLRDDYGEERLMIVGTASDGLVLVVVYTEREDRIRIISARRATPGEEQGYRQQKA